MEGRRPHYMTNPPSNGKAGRGSGQSFARGGDRPCRSLVRPPNYACFAYCWTALGNELHLRRRHSQPRDSPISICAPSSCVSWVQRPELRNQRTQSRRKLGFRIDVGFCRHPRIIPSNPRSVSSLSTSLWACLRPLTSRLKGKFQGRFRSVTASSTCSG